MQHHPLVTFAIIAFNQQKYIRQAVEGALSQTYDRLEIILSDDCSTDDTFQIMLEMAESYRGPHKIKPRKNPQNVGLLQHLQLLTEEATGSFLVLAAGDDISKPNRTTRLVEARAQGHRAACSSYDLIAPDGEVLARDTKLSSDAQHRLPWIRHHRFEEFVYGATSSYDIDIVRMLPRTQIRVMSEDSPLNTIIQVLGTRPAVVEESLVSYRAHDESISDSKALRIGIRPLAESERRREKSSVNTVNMLGYIRSISESLATSDIDVGVLEDEIRIHNDKARWSSYGIASRLKRILRETNSSQRKWMLIRIAGLYSYIPLKIIAMMARGGRADRESVWAK